MLWEKKKLNVSEFRLFWFKSVTDIEKRSLECDFVGQTEMKSTQYCKPRVLFQPRIYLGT